MPDAIILLCDEYICFWLFFFLSDLNLDVVYASSMLYLVFGSRGDQKCHFCVMNVVVKSMNYHLLPFLDHILYFIIRSNSKYVINVS